MSDEPLDQPDFVETFAATTTDLPEGVNLYYTNARARASLSAGFGISYDDNTGVISYGGFGSDDTLLSVGLNNVGDLLDIGFVGKYVSAGTKYTGLFRDATDGKYKLYQGLTAAPTANVVDLTGGVLADLSVGNLTANTLTGTLQTGSQPNITTLSGVTTIRNISIGINAIGDGSTALTGILQTGVQPLITTLDNVTSLNATPIGTNSIGNSATVLNGVLQTSAQPNIATLANVSSINSVPIGPNSVGDDTTALGGVLLTDHQPLIATLPSLSNFNGIPVSPNSLGNSSTALSGVLQTGSQPNITVLAGVTSVNGIPVSANSIGNSSTTLNGVLQTVGQPNILLTEYNLTSLTDVTVANATTTKHGLMPKLSGSATDMFLGNGTWGSISTETLPSLLLNGPTNLGDTVDIGFLGKYVLSGDKYTGLFRDATDGKYKLYHGITVAPSANVVDLTSGVLSELVLGTLTANNLTGTLQTTSQPYITTLASITSLNSIPVSANAIGNGSTALLGVIQTPSQPLITTLSGVTNINGVPISNNSIGNHNTALYGVLQTPSRPNVPTLAGVVSINSIPVGPNSLGSSATALTGILQTPLQPNLNVLESNLSGFTDITVANSDVSKHGLLPKLSGSSTDVLRGNGTWGAVVGGVIASLESLSIFGDNNPTDLLDIGFLGSYTSAGTKYTGLFRDATDGKYKLYHGLTVAPSSGVVDLTSGVLSELVVGTLTATTVSATNITGTLQTSSQPNIAIVETNLASFTDVTTANATSLKHGLLPKLSNIATDVLRGDGSWGTAPVGNLSSLMLPNPANPADLLDIGFLGTYVSAGTKYTGLFRDATDGKYKLYHGLTVAPTANVVDLTSGVLSELVLGTLTATTVAGTLSTVSQPNITTLAGVTSLNSITVGSGTLSGLSSVSSTSITGTLATVSQPNITTLAGVTSIGANNATTLTGTLQTASQPNITTLAGVTSLNGWTVGSGTLSGGSSISATSITGTLATASQPNITTLAGVTSLNSIIVGSGTLAGLSSISATSITGTLATVSQPNITTLAGATSVNSIPISANALGNGSTALTGVVQTVSQPNITTLAGVTSIGASGATTLTGTLQTVSQPNVTTLAGVTSLNGITIGSNSINVNDLSVVNLTTTGTTTMVNSTNLSITDPLIALASNNTATDVLDIGIYGAYASAGTKYTAFFRDATDGKFKLYTTLVVLPTTTVDTASGVLAELVVGTLTSTTLAGTLSTVSQPNVTTLAGVTSLNSITVGSGTLSGLSSVSSTSITGTLATVSQPNITTLASVTSLNGWTVGSGTLSGGSSISATSITGTLATVSQPNITTLAGVTSLNGWTVGSGTLSGAALTLSNTLVSLGSGNPADLLDVGLFGAYTSAGVKYTGLFRDATDGKYKLYHGLTVAPTSNVVDLTSGVLSELVLGTLLARSGNINISSDTAASFIHTTLAGTETSLYGVAKAATQFSASAAIGDAVIRSTANKLILQSGVGAAAVVINTSNFVGLGTAAPLNVLDVVKSITVDNLSTMRSIRLGVDANPSYSGYLGYGVMTGGVYSTVIQSIDNGIGSPIMLNPTGGNVGIGITTPLEKLHVLAGNIEGIRIQSTNCSALKLYTDAASADARNWMVCQQYSDNGDFSIVSSAAQGGAPTGNTRLQITRTGTVNLGTTTASNFRLNSNGFSHFGDAYDGSLYGTVQITRPASQGSAHHLSFIRNGVLVAGMGFRNNSSSFYLSNAAGDNTSLFGISIADTGFVGIGLHTPTAKLHINHPIYGSTLGSLKCDYVPNSIEYGHYGHSIGTAHWLPASNTWRTETDGLSRGVSAISFGYHNLNFYAGFTGGTTPINISNADMLTFLRMTIASSGYVGIGTISPSAPLMVNGVDGAAVSIRTHRAASSINFGTGIAFSLLNASSAVVDYANIYGGILANTAGSHSGFMSFFTPNAGANTEKMRLTNLGRFGIGTDSPGAMVHVLNQTADLRLERAANTGTCGLTIRPNGVTNSGNPEFYLGLTASNAPLSMIASGGEVFKCNGNATFQFSQLTTNGTLITTNSNGTVAVSSDSRLKHDIQYITESALPKIMGLKPATFKFNTDESNGSYTGFIAQDVQEFLPDAVDGKKHEYQFAKDAEGKIQLDENDEPVYDYEKPRYRGLSDIAIIAHLVKAVQELTTRLEAAENLIATLTNEP